MVIYHTKTHLIIFIIFSYFFFINCIVEIPLIREKSRRISKYKNITIKKSTFDYQKFFRLPIFNEGGLWLSYDNLFLTFIKIGVPLYLRDDQFLYQILDTRSQITWVAGPFCQNKYSSKIRYYYSPKFSNTSQNTQESFNITLSSGNASGYYYTDNFKYIGDKYFNMKFGVANYTEFNLESGSGIIGLGRQCSDENMSFIHMLKKYEATDSTIFSIKFGGELENVDSYGELYIGNHEDFSSNYSVSCPLVKEFKCYWVCKLDGFSLKKEEIELKSKKSNNIIFDTTIDKIILPMEYLNDIKDDLIKMNCSYSSARLSEIPPTYNQINCSGPNDTLPDFRFKINGNILTIPSDFVFDKYNRDGFYLSNYLFFGNSEEYVFGTPFFMIFHTQFDGDNNKMKFYPREPKYIEKGEENEGGKDKKMLLFVVCGIAGFILLIGIIILICCLVKSKKGKKEEEIEKNVENTEPIL